MNQAILITGASSYTGSFLIDKLLSETNYDLVLTGRNADRIGNTDHPKVHFHQSDLMYPTTYLPIFVKYPIKAIFHLGAMARVHEGEQNPIDSIKTNYLATLELMKMANDHFVESMIFTSSDLAREALSVVGMCKYMVEDAFRLSAGVTTKLITLRLANVKDSPGTVTLLFKKQIRSGQSISITHPKMSRRFITGKQAADWLLYALINGKHRDVFVSTEKALNITDLAFQLMDELKQTAPIQYIGIKPGERLSEKGYTKSKTSPTQVPGLGRIKTNQMIVSETQRISKHLMDLAIKYGDKEVVRALNRQFKYRNK